MNMPTDFDQFPVYDDLVSPKSLKMSDVWVNFMGTFFENLTSYLTSQGIFIPELNQQQVNQLTNATQARIFYNTTIGKYQCFENGILKTFTTS